MKSTDGSPLSSPRGDVCLPKLLSVGSHFCSKLQILNGKRQMIGLKMLNAKIIC